MGDVLVDLLNKYRMKNEEYTKLMNDKNNNEKKEEINKLYTEMEEIKEDIEYEVRGLNGAGT